jgi:hypothetical protein
MLWHEHAHDCYPRLHLYMQFSSLLETMMNGADWLLNVSEFMTSLLLMDLSFQHVNPVSLPTQFHGPF